MPGRKFSSATQYRYGFNGKENDNDVKGEGNSVHFEFRDYDSRIGRFTSIDPIANNYPWQSPYAFAANNPVALVDLLGMGPGDPLEHKVVKGDNLTTISKKYGVSIDDLVFMNGIEDKNKLKVGQILNVNPEANFSKNPRGGYSNPDEAKGDEVNVAKISKVGTGFISGKSKENSVIVGGGALSSVQNWNEVKSLVSEGVAKILRDGKAIPGEAYVFTFKAGSLPTNAVKGIVEFFVEKKPWKDNSQNSPIHVLGSFNLSVRVNANGTTATVCIYDSKTFKSFSDGNASEDANRKRKDYYVSSLTNTYQRYLWVIKL